MIFEESLANLSSLFNRIICPARSSVLMPGNMNHKPALYPISVPLLFRLFCYDIVCPFTVKSLSYQLAFGYTAISFKVKHSQYCHHLIAYYFLYCFFYKIFHYLSITNLKYYNLSEVQLLLSKLLDSTAVVASLLQSVTVKFKVSHNDTIPW